ncbi:MAG TPA: phosphatidate cytidylyltransferase [Armatimonadota bacterium]
MLRQRLIAALFGLPMLALLLWLNWFLRGKGSMDDLPLLATVVIIAGASGWEFARIVKQRYPKTILLHGVYAALILPFMIHAIRLSMTPGGLIPVGSVGLLIDSLGTTAGVMLLFLGIWTDVEQRGRDGLMQNLFILGGGLYLGTTTAALLLLGATPLHEIAVMFVFLLVFTLDTAAYFGGKYLKGPQLAPHISPKKTISGAIIGLLGTVLLAAVVKYTGVPWGNIPPPEHHPWWNLGAFLTWWQLGVVAIAVGIFGQVGDLAESYMKRWGGVKDSGVILPGHGGFLDRFDSLFLAAPITYLLLIRFLHLPFGW